MTETVQEGQVVDEMDVHGAGVSHQGFSHRGFDIHGTLTDKLGTTYKWTIQIIIATWATEGSGD
jgi:hypothetical protein